jgi:hypothetical protein
MVSDANFQHSWRYYSITAPFRREMMTDFKKLMTVALTIMLVQGVLALLISSTANAQESLMTTLDNDQDGLISLREAAGHRTQLEILIKLTVMKTVTLV